MPVESQQHIVGLTVEAPHTIGYRTLEQTVPPGFFSAKIQRSSISPGTELVAYAPPTESAAKKIEYPVKKSGYANTAIVTETNFGSSPLLSEGDRISMNIGHRTGAVEEFDGTSSNGKSSKDRWIKLPDDVDDELGTLVAQMMPIALAGIITLANQFHNGKELTTLENSLEGKRVAVNGAGLIGILLSEGLRYAGIEQGVMVDEWPQRMVHAENAGMMSINFKEVDSVPEAVRSIFSRPRIIRDVNYGPGPDGYINTAPNKHALTNALKSTRDQGRVVDMAFYAEEVGLPLGEDFHHRGVRLVPGQIGNIPEEQQPMWTRRRLAEIGLEIIQDRGPEIKQALFTHRAEFKDAAVVFEDYATRNPDRLVTVFTPGDVSHLPMQPWNA